VTPTLTAGVWVVQAEGRNCPHPCHVANGSLPAGGKGGGMGGATTEGRRRAQPVEQGRRPLQPRSGHVLYGV